MSAHTEKKSPRKMKTLSITLSEDNLEILQRIARDIGTQTYSAAVRYLINRYIADYPQKKVVEDEP